MIHLVAGTMHSGKTRKLIQMSETFKDISDVYILKPKKDKKANNFVISGDKKIKCDFLIDGEETLLSFLTGVPTNGDVTYLIDEAQFLTLEEFEVIKEFRDYNIWLFGLISDSNGKMWSVMKDIFNDPRIDVYYTKNLCEEGSGKVAIFNKKIFGIDSLVDIEDNGTIYKAVSGEKWHE